MSAESVDPSMRGPGPRRTRSPRGAMALGVLAAVLTLPAACSEGAGGDVLLVASGFTDEVLLLDPETGATVDVRATDPRPTERDEPHAVAVSPDGRHWYATVSHGEPSLWKYESAGDRQVGRLDLASRGAGRIGLSPDGETAIVPDYWLGGIGETSEIVAVRTRDLTIAARATVCAAPHDAVFSPDGSRVAVTCPLSDELLLVDPATLEVLVRTPIPDREGMVGAPGTPETRPMNAAWSADGSRIYVTLMRTGEVAVLDGDGAGVARAVVGGGPTQVAVTPDGSTLIVPLRDDWAVAVVDAETLAVRSLVATPELPHPHGVTLDPEGGRAFVTHEGTIRSPGGVSAIDLAEGTLLWSRSAGSFNLGIAFRPAPGGGR